MIQNDLQTSGCIIIKPNIIGDDRGYFYESYNKQDFQRRFTISTEFVQDNQSKSHKGVLRGLHYQLPPFTQAKIVRVLDGEVLDVAVDLRKNSPTFGQYTSAVLSSENKHQLYIPRGFAHGFLTLSDTAVFFYKCDNYYAPEYERGIIFDDDTINIKWPISPELIKLSSKDINLPSLREAENPF